MLRLSRRAHALPTLLIAAIDPTASRLSWGERSAYAAPTPDKNLLATLLLSQGTPMLLAGDEFGRTQRGNNNAYCQDSEIIWLDWDIEEEGRSLIGFVRRLTELRRHYPILRRSRFLTGEFNEELGLKNVTWINASGHGDASRGCIALAS